MAERKEVLVRIAVVGAGVIGAYRGAALHPGGAEVHLIARNQHLEAMRSHGVKVISPRGDFGAQPHATDDPAEVGPVDYVELADITEAAAPTLRTVHAATDLLARTCTPTAAPQEERR
jgi:ketopantoate reductase